MEHKQSWGRRVLRALFPLTPYKDHVQAFAICSSQRIPRAREKPKCGADAPLSMCLYFEISNAILALDAQRQRAWPKHKPNSLICKSKQKDEGKTHLVIACDREPARNLGVNFLHSVVYLLSLPPARNAESRQILRELLLTLQAPVP